MNSTYQEVLDWLFMQVPNYQKEGIKAYKPGLENMHSLARHWDNPQNQFKSIHIAGTNGKGSTSHMLASILQEQGYKVGLFTSPHFKDFTERIRINGQQAKPHQVMSFIEDFRKLNLAESYSFFEITTQMAFEIFAQEKVDYAFIETGLGGRLDSTNIITPILSVITTIGLDHTHILGESIEEIAFEKAGIIKKEVPLVIGNLPPKAEQVIFEKAKAQNAPIYFSKEIAEVYPSDLQGAFQIENQKTVLQSINVLQKEGVDIDPTAIENGLLHVQKNTSLQGRWQLKQTNPNVIWDTAHNPMGIAAAFKEIQQLNPNPLFVVMGFVQDKEIKSIIRLLPVNDTSYIFTKPSSPRGISPMSYESQLNGLNYQIIENSRKAYETALERAKAEDTILVIGSNFLIADLM